jgi:hypothetical protein
LISLTTKFTKFTKNRKLLFLTFVLFVAFVVETILSSLAAALQRWVIRGAHSTARIPDERKILTADFQPARRSAVRLCRGIDSAVGNSVS